VGRVLLASIVAMELGVVAINVLINQWNAFGQARCVKKA